MNKDCKKIVDYIDSRKIKSIPRLFIDKKGNIIPVSFDFVEYDERTINNLKRNFKLCRTNKIKVFNNI